MIDVCSFQPLFHQFFKGDSGRNDDGGMDPEIVDPDVERDLKERWDDLTSWVGEDVRNRWWDRLRRAYMEPHRKYHNLFHLHQMFQHYDQHKDSLQNCCSCAYAIFFHDIVYDPKAKDNEAKSSELFHQFASETTLDEATNITALIEATASHCTEAHLDSENTGTADVHYFLDIDMAILGSEPDDYDLYKEQIRQEYSHLDPSTYARERAKVLRLFLQIPNIFATQVFRESYEQRARENIKREIAGLHESER